MKKSGQLDTSPKNPNIDYNELPTTLIDRSKIAVRLIRTPRCKRVVDYIADHPEATTAEISATCAVGNVSDAFEVVRPTLSRLGLGVVCIHPNPPLKNRFGQTTTMCRWKLFLLGDKAA